MNTSPLGSPDRPTASTPEPRLGGPPRLPAWARVVITTALFLPIAMTAALPMLVPGYTAMSQREDGLGTLAFAIAAAVALTAYVLVSWALVRWIDRRPFAALGLRLDGREGLGLFAGVGIAVVAGALAAGATGALGLARTLDPAVVAQQVAQQSVLTVVVYTILRAFVLQGIGEEVLFRGYLLQSLRRRPVLAVVVAALAFTLPHFASSGGQENLFERVLYLAVPFGFSISAGFLAIACRSVWAAVGIHGGFHVASAVNLALGLTADGPGMWLTAGALHVVIGVVVALLIPRSRWAEVRERGPYGRPVPAAG